MQHSQKGLNLDNKVDVTNFLSGNRQFLCKGIVMQKQIITGYKFSETSNKSSQLLFYVIYKTYHVTLWQSQKTEGRSFPILSTEPIYRRFATLFRVLSRIFFVHTISETRRNGNLQLRNISNKLMEWIILGVPRCGTDVNTSDVGN